MGRPHPLNILLGVHRVHEPAAAATHGCTHTVAHTVALRSGIHSAAAQREQGASDSRGGEQKQGPGVQCKDAACRQADGWAGGQGNPHVRVCEFATGRGGVAQCWLVTSRRVHLGASHTWMHHYIFRICLNKRLLILQSAITQEALMPSMRLEMPSMGSNLENHTHASAKPHHSAVTGEIEATAWARIARDAPVGPTRLQEPWPAQGPWPAQEPWQAQLTGQQTAGQQQEWERVRQSGERFSGSGGGDHRDFAHR